MTTSPQLWSRTPDKMSHHSYSVLGRQQAGSSSAPPRCNRSSRRRCVASRALLTTSTPAATANNIEALKKTRLVTAVKTPYRPDGKFDLHTYDSILVNQIANGVEGVIVGGTTGEGHLMSWDEHIMLIAHTVRGGGTWDVGGMREESPRRLHACVGEYRYVAVALLQAQALRFCFCPHAGPSAPTPSANCRATGLPALLQQHFHNYPALWWGKYVQSGSHTHEGISN